MEEISVALPFAGGGYVVGLIAAVSSFFLEQQFERSRPPLLGTSPAHRGVRSHLLTIVVTPLRGIARD